MTVSQATKKKLFATSGNECAFPGCEEELVDREEETVIGVIAHIRARSEEGPRFDPELSKDERDEFSNLIVLCPNHHTRIDKNPGKYPVDEIKQWKEQHEKQATDVPDVPDELIDNLESEGTDPEKELVDWTSKKIDIWRENVNDNYGSIDNSPYSDGYEIFSYKVFGDINEPSLRELKDIMRDVKGNETGWPPWCGIDNAKPMDGEIEVWLNHLTERDAHERTDFWRASTKGEVFLLTPYPEDYTDKNPPGELLDYILPFLNVGERLLHIKRFAERVSNGKPSAVVHIRWSRLKGRELGQLVHRGGWPPKNHSVHRDEVEVVKTVPVSKIENSLTEVVYELTLPLYHAFDFYEPDKELIDTTLQDVLG